MRRIVLCLVLFFWAYFPVCHAADFRKSSWGDNLKKVKASEKKKPDFERADTLGYKDVLAGLDVSVLFQFEAGRLVKGVYIIDNKHTNSFAYIEDHQSIIRLLIKKYGEKAEENVRWTDNLYKDDIQQWGLAVLTGRVSFFSGWKTDKSYISAMLNGDNFKASHMIIYEDKAHFEKSLKEGGDKSLENL